MKNILLALSLSAFCAGVYAEPLLFIAHRGEHYTVPENTVAAWKMAVENGADGVECDVRLSKDGVLVISHDADLHRFSSEQPAKKINELTLAELKAIDLTGLLRHEHPDAPPTQERIATFAELLAAVPKGTYMHIEPKDPGREFCEAVATEIRRSGHPADRVRISTFNANNVRDMKSFLPEYSVNLICGMKWDPEKQQYDRSLESLIQKAKDCNADGISLPFDKHWDDALVKTIRDAGLLLACYNVKTVEQVQAARVFGMNRFTSDNASILKKQVAEADQKINQTKTNTP